MAKFKYSISEKIIEDILCADKSLISEILTSNISDISLISRQRNVKSGKLDLLYLCNNKIYLIELKAVPFYIDIIEQINNYHIDLVELQLQNKLINGEIIKIIMVPEFDKKHTKICEDSNIRIITFNPSDFLNRYYQNFKEQSQFLKIQSADYGVVRIGLIKNTLSYLAQGLSLIDIAKIEEKSIITINHRIAVAQQLDLISKNKKNIYLTDFGNSFVELSNEILDERLNESQIDLLSNFIKENPFYSSITYTIISIIESVFVLSKSIYPIPFENLKDYFIKSVGKTDTWNKEQARKTATIIFSNYAIELGFLVRVDNQFYLTPLGTQAVLLLQLNRSIKLIQTK